MITRAGIGLLVGATSLRRPLHHSLKKYSSERQHLSTLVPLSSSVLGIDDITTDFQHDISAHKVELERSTFNPLGPPERLASLGIGHSISIPHPFGGEHESVNIKRLSRDPDIFLLQNILACDEMRLALRNSALEQGLKVAGTRKSDENAIRKNSYLAWIDAEEVEPEGELSNIMSNMGRFVVDAFVHESLRNEWDLYELESIQVAKYDEGGRFDEHHDGFGRFVTVLSYLNGIGGTYFPYAQTNEGKPANEFVISNVPGRNGLLVTGHEGSTPYFSHESEESAVVQIQPGDAVAFYNYNVGGRILSSVHSSLSVPSEKWIATNWLRSEKLTGSHGFLHVQNLSNQKQNYM